MRITCLAATLIIFVISGCGGLVAGAEKETDEESHLTEAFVTTEGEATATGAGALSYKFDPSSDQGMLLKPAQDSAIKDSIITLPPGALEGENTILVEEGLPIYESGFTDLIGFSNDTSLSRAGDSVSILPGTEENLVKEIRVGLSIDDSLQLQNKETLYVVFLGIRYGENSTKIVSFKRPFHVDQGIAYVRGKYFGTYALVHSSTALDEVEDRELEAGTFSGIGAYHGRWQYCDFSYPDSTALTTLKIDASKRKLHWELASFGEGEPCTGDAVYSYRSEFSFSAEEEKFVIKNERHIMTMGASSIEGANTDEVCGFTDWQAAVIREIPASCFEEYNMDIPLVYAKDAEHLWTLGLLDNDSLSIASQSSHETPYKMLLMRIAKSADTENEAMSTLSEKIPLELGSIGLHVVNKSGETLRGFEVKFRGLYSLHASGSGRGSIDSIDNYYKSKDLVPGLYKVSLIYKETDESEALSTHEMEVEIKAGRQLNLSVSYNAKDNWSADQSESAHFSIEDFVADFSTSKVKAKIVSKDGTHYKFKAIIGNYEGICSSEEGYSEEVAINQSIDTSIDVVYNSMGVCVIVKDADGRYTPVKQFKYHYTTQAQESSSSLTSK